MALHLLKIGLLDTEEGTSHLHHNYENMAHIHYLLSDWVDPVCLNSVCV
jgi:hypothetical protein